MEETQHFVRAYHNQTTLHPLALLIFIGFVIYIFVSDYKMMLLPFILLTCFISSAQRLVIAGFDFTLFRLLIVIGWIKLIAIGKKLTVIKWQRIDSLILILMVVQCLAFLLRAPGKIVYIVGITFDSIGAYFLFRFVIRKPEDIKRPIIIFMTISVPVAIFFLIEKNTGRNMFSIFGGVPEITQIREGRLRCTGAFAHPILAGCFWASVAALYFGLFWDNSVKNRFILIGTICNLIIIYTCASSTPILSFAAGIFATYMFKHRRHIPDILKIIVFGLIVLQLSMDQPLWHLIGRIQLVGGSTGYHRYRLIDAFFNNFTEWALIGITSTAHWGFGLVDITNQFIAEGAKGGLISLIIFIILIREVFRCVRKGLIKSQGSLRDERLVWSIGASFFTHLVSFLSVSYFGQIYMLWYLTLAMAGSLIELDKKNE